jgi:hypothetical protein
MLLRRTLVGHERPSHPLEIRFEAIFQRRRRRNNKSISKKILKLT